MDRARNMVVVEMTGLREAGQGLLKSPSLLVAGYLQCDNGHEVAGGIRWSGENMPR